MTDVLTDETEIERLLRAGIPARQVAQQLIEPLATVMHVLERLRRSKAVRTSERPELQEVAVPCNSLQLIATETHAAADVPHCPVDVPHRPSDVSQALLEEPSQTAPTPPGLPETVRENLSHDEVRSPQPACEHDGCTEPATRKGLCRRHYDRRRDADRAGKRNREDTIIRTRARNRAVAQLVQAHKNEFDRLMEETREQVMREMYELRAEAEKRGVKAENGIVRLRTGPRPDDQTIGDRIREDVGSCPHCHSHHDGGHLCIECGADLTGEGQLASAVGDGTTPKISGTEKWKRDGAERGRRLMERRKRETEQAVRRQLRQVR